LRNGGLRDRKPGGDIGGRQAAIAQKIAQFSGSSFTIDAP